MDTINDLHAGKDGSPIGKINSPRTSKTAGHRDASLALRLKIVNVNTTPKRLRKRASEGFPINPKTSCEINTAQSLVAREGTSSAASPSRTPTDTSVAYSYHHLVDGARDKRNVSGFLSRTEYRKLRAVQQTKHCSSHRAGQTSGPSPHILHNATWRLLRPGGSTSTHPPEDADAKVRTL